MTRIALLLCCALSLAACNTMSASAVASAGATVADAAQLAPPLTYADKTSLDEAGAIGFDAAIGAAADAATLAVKFHVIKKADLPRLKVLSRQAREAVVAVGAAYRTGNAASYHDAVQQANAAIAAVRAMAMGGGN